MSSRPSEMPLTRPGVLRLYSTDELVRMPPPEWQIDGIIPLGGLVGLYGPPGVGKSFIAIDMALHLASGRSWQGHDVRKGYVLYVSAEGGTGIGKRVQAWMRYHQVTPKELPVAWLTETIAVTNDSQDMERLFERLTEVEDHPEFIVIDTLARCFDGDENQQEDMGRFIGGVDKLRTQYRSTVCIVHHTRLDGERERGNTAFRGAADCMMSVERPTKQGTSMLLKCNKQKDSEEFGTMGMALLSVPEVESCVIVPQSLPDHIRSKQIKASEILKVLVDNAPLTWDEWFQLSENLVSRATFGRRVAEFRDTQQIIKENGRFRPIIAE